MKSVFTAILVILVLLALSSGITKLLLMEQDVNFFVRHGFTRSMLMTFGFVQVLRSLLMVFAKTRFVGAAVIGVTFLVSLVLLIVDGNLPIGILTVIAILLLGVVMKQSWRVNPR